MLAALQDWQALTSCTKVHNVCPNVWTLAALLASPHFLYAFIWYRPHLWRRTFGNAAVDVFALFGTLGKGDWMIHSLASHCPLPGAASHPTAATACVSHAVVQFTAVLLWWSCNREQGICLDPSRIGLIQWLAALALVAFGQSLNAGIFTAIGHEGVYYGFKLGKKVPWVNGWPFDTVSHPQYVGSVLTVWGMAALVWGQAPPSLPVLVALWTALYVITGVQEDRL